MKKLLFNRNTIYNLIIHISILLFNFIILYFFVYDVHDIFLFLIMIPNIIICIIMICVFEFFKNNKFFKNKKQPTKKDEKKNNIKNKIKIIDSLKINKFCAIFMIFIIIFYQIYFFPYSFENGLMLCIPFLVFILYKSSVHKNPKLVIDYNEKFLYCNDEKISFEGIKEYSVQFKNIICKCTVYLKDDREIKYYERLGLNDFKLSLIKNLRYLKIPERILD